MSNNNNTIKYSRDAIIESEEFKCYQKDFLKAILTKEEYSLAEARKIASEYFNAKE